MQMAAAPLLSVEHLSMRFGGVTAIDDLSFSARRGEITALIGSNGVGKTTVFNCVTGIYKPNAGRLLLIRGDAATPEEIEALALSGRRHAKTARGEIFLLERMPDFEAALRAGIARIFQNIRLFAGMTLIENPHRRAAPFPPRRTFFGHRGLARPAGLPRKGAASDRDRPL